MQVNVCVCGFFFFQAEDGIRDYKVTGVQTCALPISGTYRGPDGKLIKVAPLSDEDKLTLARWIDIGCPIDREYDPKQRGQGWLLDEGRPTLTLSYPQSGTSKEPLTRILIGMHDYGTCLDLAAFSVTADFT